MRQLLSAAIADLQDRLSVACCELGEFQVYLFGSAIRGIDYPNDIDVLLVYPTGGLSKAVPAITMMREIEGPIEFDVIALSSEEQVETDFIRNTQAKLIWKS